MTIEQNDTISTIAKTSLFLHMFCLTNVYNLSCQYKVKFGIFQILDLKVYLFKKALVTYLSFKQLFWFWNLDLMYLFHECDIIEKVAIQQPCH